MNIKLISSTSLILLSIIFTNAHSQVIENGIVKIAQGSLKGVELKSRSGKSFWGFLGIPYGQAARFKSPEPAANWDGLRNASEAGPSCLQFNLDSMSVEGSESCLTANVFTPNKISGNDTGNFTKTKSPVLVFIHSGAFFHGSGNEFKPDFLLDEDVVVITFNYRLGPFGFLSTGGGSDSDILGNQGLKDQVLLLKWVKENVGSFGGDSNSVTIFGHGAGATSASLHILSSSSAGLFHKAILGSGNALCPWSIETNPTEVSKTLAEMLDCQTNSTNLLVQCLQAKSGREIASTVPRFFQWFLDPIAPFAPSIDTASKDSFLPYDPVKIWKNGPINKVPVLLGLVRDEGSVKAQLVLSNPLTTEQLDKEWNTFAPITLNYENSEETSTRIRNFYFGGASSQISRATAGALTKMYTDRNYGHCTKEGAISHSKHSPTFLYVFTFKDENVTGLNEFGIYTDKYIAHGEDLFYLMPIPRVYPNKFVENSNSEIMSKKMVKIWTDFASKGVPSENWRPLVPSNSTTLKWQELNINSKELDESRGFTERLKFWGGLGLGKKDEPAINDISSAQSENTQIVVRQAPTLNTSSRSSTTSRTPVTTTTRRTTTTTTTRRGLLASILGGGGSGNSSSASGGFLSRVVARLRSFFQFWVNLARNLFTRVRGLVGGSSQSSQSLF